jgi:DNA relaxase NicK
VKALRERFRHQVTRVDSCADFDAPRAFERLLGPCMDVKRAHRLKGRRDGDWEDFPELGRTQYVGSPQSVAMVRLYEKGKQPEYRHLERPNWARLEVQVRPAKEAKATFADLSAQQVWGATAWTRALAGQVLQDHIDAHPAGTVYRQSDSERKSEWLCRQYGPHLLDLLADLGSWECVGLTLAEIIKRQKDAR